MFDCMIAAFRVRIRLFLLVLVLITSIQSKGQVGSLTKPSDVKKWITDNFAKGKVPPFSFIYGGASSKTFITRWNFKVEELKSEDPTVNRLNFTYTDPKSSLTVKCEVKYFNDFPAVEWTLHFSNRSAAENTRVIEDMLVLNYDFQYQAKQNIVVHSAKGSNAKREDFQPTSDTLSLNKTISKSPVGGRSSDTSGFPFFNIETPDAAGIMLAIGWSGQWKANFNQSKPNSVTTQVGLGKFKAYLVGSESVRGPKVSLLFWKGDDRMVGHNEFRKLVFAHYTRKIDGQVPQLPFASFLDREGPQPCNEHVCATEINSVAEINRFKQFDMLPEVFWLDAGWYPCNGNWGNVGNWKPNPVNFPNGLQPISNEAKKNGAKFLLWFEPERYVKANQSSTLHKEHPDWFIDIPKRDNLLLNLGNPEARTWITNHIAKIIEESGVDYYRQDFNMEPAPYWAQLDTPDRTGIAEVKHIAGLYEFWDKLVERFPRLIIDNCASGGRRLDLETTSRSTPFWRTDYAYGEPIGSQCHTYGLNFFLPLSGTGAFEPTTYHLRSAMSSNLVVHWDIHNKKHKISTFQGLIKEFKLLRPYYYFSDYYPLTPIDQSTNLNSWMAYQLNRTKERDGIVMAFRRPDVADTTLVVKLKGLDDSTVYQLTNLDTKEIVTANGATLKKGLTLTSVSNPGSVCLLYKVAQ